MPARWIIYSVICFPPKMHLEEKLKVAGISFSVQITSSVFFFFFTKALKTFLFTMFGVWRKHGVLPVKHDRLAKQMKFFLLLMPICFHVRVYVCLCV